jgi:hypothetical protein
MKIDKILPFILVAAANMNLANAVMAMPGDINHNYCPSGEESIAAKIKFSAETSQFYINICKNVGEPGSIYVGVPKAKNGKSLYTSLIKEKPNFYVGANGIYRYVVDATNKELRVFKGSRLILKQKLYKIESYN